MTDVERPQPTEAEAKAAYEQHQAIITTAREMKRLWIRLAEQLYEFQQNKGWRALGYSSFEKWLNDPDVELNRRNAFYLIESWRELVVERGVEPEQLENLEVSKVREVMPAIRRGAVEIEDALADAEVMPREDLRVKYAGVGRPGETPRIGTEPLNAEREPEWATCQSCGSRYQLRRAA